MKAPASRGTRTLSSTARNAARHVAQDTCRWRRPACPLQCCCLACFLFLESLPGFTTNLLASHVQHQCTAARKRTTTTAKKKKWWVHTALVGHKTKQHRLQHSERRIGWTCVFCCFQLLPSGFAGAIQACVIAGRLVLAAAWAQDRLFIQGCQGYHHCCKLLLGLGLLLTLGLRPADRQELSQNGSPERLSKSEPMWTLGLQETIGSVFRIRSGVTGETPILEGLSHGPAKIQSATSREASQYIGQIASRSM